MEKNNLKIWVWGVVAIIVVVIVIIFFIYQSGQTVNPLIIESELKSVQDINNKDTGIMAAVISYNDALIKYVDRRIQLDKDCHAYPGNATYKDNTGIMIDNRSPKTRTVKVGTIFTIKPWGFKIVVLPNIYLATKTILVDCDNSQNVATILVQE